MRLPARRASLLILGLGLLMLPFLCLATDTPHPKANSPSATPQHLRHVLDWLLEHQVRVALGEGREQDAIAAYERAVALAGKVGLYEQDAWQLALAYKSLGKVDEAIGIFKPYLPDLDAMSTQERAQLGEKLIFGQIGARPDKWGVPLGRGLCPLCHTFEFPPDPTLSRRSPPLAGVINRVKRLIETPDYRLRTNDTVQPEALPGSRIATSVIEYLAESHVCPSCYIVPGYGYYVDENTGLYESKEPRLHTPPISLSVEQLIAIDTWLFVQEGENPPPLETMRAAYTKFLPREDWPGSEAGIQLASLYDEQGDTQAAVREGLNNSRLLSDQDAKHREFDRPLFRNLN